MREVTVSDARARLAEVVDAAWVGHEPVYLTRRGRRVAAVVDADDLDRLLAAAEDLADIEAARVPPGVKNLVGGDGEWRVRTGDHRIVYEIDDGVLRVLVLALGHRREIYRRR